MISANFQRLARTIAVGSLVTATVIGCQQPKPPSLGPEWEPGHYRDSLIRAVPLDSLHALYRAMLTADDAKAIERQIVCEGSRLNYLYGGYIATTAINRMRDTLWHPQDRDALERMDAKLAGGMGGVGARNCPMPRDRPPAPDSLNVFPPFKRKKP
ncbi:MAG TPA: hypothetical protein VN651_08780 [Gemmatimonadaceae bacterium]|nr:hypothetical protein [Gemmatimonadaceae bacterium]